MNGVWCYCNPCGGPDYVENGTCLLQPGGQCFSAIHEEFNKEEGIYESVRSFGCISESDNALLQCKGDIVPSKNLQSVQCCNFTDECNKILLPELKPRSMIQPSNSFIHSNFFCMVFVITISFAFIFLTLYAIFLCYKPSKEKKGSRKYRTKQLNTKLQPHNMMSNRNISSTGSGAGKPLLLQTTIGRQIKRSFWLGRGRFTEVYVGEWNAAKIVEKIFSTNEEERWTREKKIYETALLQHKNVLGYISSDILTSGLRAIYTDYHKLGSLHDYLDQTSLNASDFLKLVETAATGIAHLHVEIFGTTRLPPVAHRDITSKNFLVSASRECVIANFEIAIMPISSTDDTVIEPDVTQGTARYMAPEIVLGTIKSDSFEAFKSADIYSLGLVLYEICQRCATVEGNRYTVDEHTLPFFDVLPKIPNINDMKALFASKKPKEDLLSIPQRWENDIKTLKPFCHIMRECFYENPKARPNAVRLKKSIMSLHHYDPNKQGDIL